MYVGPPPPQRDDPSPGPTKPAGVRKSDPSTDQAEPRPARTRPGRADEEADTVQFGRALFCAGCLIWAMLGIPSVIRLNEQGNTTEASGAAAAAIIKAGIGLLVGGRALLQWVSAPTKTTEVRRPRRPTSVEGGDRTPAGPEGP